MTIEEADKKETNEEDNKENSIKPSSLEVLLHIKDAQNQHGLRHGDYQRYRQYCSRRVRRLRKSLQFVCGNRHHFKKKILTQEIASKDARYLYIPLMCAERAWSYAMELKQLSNTEFRKRFHLIRRLKKAVYYAKELHELSEGECCDARTKLEAQAYYSWMAGNLKFELQIWNEALELYSSAKTIYEKLAGALLENQAVVYSQRANEVAPNIRYCLYNLDESSADVKELMQLKLAHGGSDLLAAKINSAINQLREKQASTLHEIVWLGKKLTIVSEQVRVLVLRYQGLTEELDRASDYDGKMEIYDGILMECKDVLQLLRDMLKSESSVSSSKSYHQRGETNTADIMSYVSYLKSSITIERNILMADALEERILQPSGTTSSKNKTKPDDLVRLYDIALQTLGDKIQIPEVERNDELSSCILAETQAFKAFRCFHVGLTYMNAKKWHEAMALFEKTITRCKDAIDRFNESKGERYQLYLQRLQQFISLAHGQKSITYAALLSGEEWDGGITEVTPELESKPLIDRLDVYYASPSVLTDKPNLIQFPPDFEPVPCKPLFFDVANNFVEFPSLDHRLEQQQTGGISGLVRGWFWGKR